jgi:hypothetical protein
MHGFFFRAFQQCLDRAPGPNQCEGALANGELFTNKTRVPEQPWSLFPSPPLPAKLLIRLSRSNEER